MRDLSKTLEIQKGKMSHGIYNSRFCEAKILQILNEVNDVIKDMHFAACFPSTKITETRIQLLNQHYDSLSFQLIHIYDSQQIIVKICDQLERLSIGQTLVLTDYPMLTQFSVGLLYILGNSFEEMMMEIHDKGYHIILKTYRSNKVLNYLHMIRDALYNALDENMSIWSIVPITILYGKVHRYISFIYRTISLPVNALPNVKILSCSLYLTMSSFSRMGPVFCNNRT